MDDTGHDMSSGLMMASEMAMTFFNSHTTPLFSLDWTPTNAGGYAGTCIFLIFLAIIFRALMVTKVMLEHRWQAQALKRRYIVVEGKQPLSERLKQELESSPAVLSANGVEEHVKVILSSGPTIQPWRFTVDLPRAILVTVMGGIGYLLMIAVMTLNIGYFFSILAGIFVGEIAIGRYLQADLGQHSH